MKDLVVAGLLVSPFVKYALLAGLMFVPLRFLLVALGLHKWFWHPPLAEAAIFLCILAALNILV